MIRPRFWHQLRRRQFSIPDHVQATIALRRLEEEQKVTESRLGEAREQLALIHESEASRLAKGIYLSWLIPLFVATIILTIGASFWGLEAFPILTAGKRMIIAASLAVLSLIGGTATGIALRLPPEAPLRRVTFGVGFCLLTLAILATLTISVVRGLDTTWLIESAQANSTLDLDQSHGGFAVSAAHRFLNALVVLAFIIAGVAGEVGAAYAADQLLVLLVPVWTITRLRRSVYRLEDTLAYVVATQEQLRHEVALGQQRDVPLLEAQTGAARSQDYDSLAALAWKIVLTILLLAGLLLGVLTYAGAAETVTSQTVALVDLSTSVGGAQGEFERNLAAVEGLMRRLRDSNHQLSVLAITKDSFQAPALLASIGPAITGRYGEYIGEWHRTLLTHWQQVRAHLTPTAVCSDHFGALARAALEFAERPVNQKRLIIFSDMRQACRGFNFEQPLKDPLGVLAQVQHQGFISRLDGVQVWALGVDTAGIDEAHWASLKTFWQEYFRQAGAQLVAFSPHRTWQR